jgi:hypothetical protein
MSTHISGRLPNLRLQSQGPYSKLEAGSDPGPLFAPLHRGVRPPLMELSPHGLQPALSRFDFF